MRKLHRFAALLTASSIVACTAAAPPPSTREEPPVVSATSEAQASDATASPSAAPTTSPAAPATSTAVATATATAAAAAPSASTKKDESALVIEPVFTMRGGGAVSPELAKALRSAFDDRLATSSKMAPAGAVVAKPRNVVVTFLVEAPKGDEKALSVRMGLTGVESVGKCPIFDVDQKFTINGAKDLAKEGLELQKMAVAALLEKLEQASGTLKPKANCTATR
jgi:hypothetical protein